MKEKTERNNLIMKMCNSGKTVREIAKLFNISFYTCRNIIEKRKGIRGSEGRDFKRELIREYFDNTCQKCGIKWQEGKRKFDVHHLSCDPKDTRKYDKEFDKKTVTLLCHKCHLNMPEHLIKMTEINIKNHELKRLKVGSRINNN